MNIPNEKLAMLNFLIQRKFVDVQLLIRNEVLFCIATTESNQEFNEDSGGRETLCKSPSFHRGG